MRLAAALIVALLAAPAARGAPRTPPAPLDSDPALARSGARAAALVAAHALRIACTGCVAVMETLDVMLRNPPAEERAAAAPRVAARASDALSAQMASRTVEVAGYDTPQPFTVRFCFAHRAARSVSSPRRWFVAAQSTEGFINETMRAVCGSRLLAEYRMCEPLALVCVYAPRSEKASPRAAGYAPSGVSCCGRRTWCPTICSPGLWSRDLPTWCVGTRAATLLRGCAEKAWLSNAVPPHGAQQASVGSSVHHRWVRFLPAANTRTRLTEQRRRFPGVACDAIVGVAQPDDVVGQLKAIAAVLQTDVAGSGWRLLPFAIVALALPFVLKPLVTGTPPLPEPRCASSARAVRSAALTQQCTEQGRCGAWRRRLRRRGGHGRCGLRAGAFSTCRFSQGQERPLTRRQKHPWTAQKKKRNLTLTPLVMGLCMRTLLAPPLVALAPHRRRRATTASVMPRADAQLSGATQVDMLKSVSRLVVDTGDLDRIALWKPTDATTNPRCAAQVLARAFACD